MPGRQPMKAPTSDQRLPASRGRRSPGAMVTGPRLAGAGLVVATALSLALLTPQPAGAATQTVTNCKDTGSGSLRQAVANAHSGDTVAFALSPSCSLLTLTSTIPIATNLTIDGPGATVLGLNENIHKTAFTVASGVTLTLSGLTIENGAVGFVNAGTLNVTDATFSDNGSVSGGAIENTGTLAVTGSTFVKNGVDAPDEGGGAIDNDGGTVTVTDSTLTDNTASGGANGGGLFNNGGSVTVTGSTFSDNNTSDGSGGVLYNQGGTTTISTSTLADNSALDGTGGAVDDNAGTVNISDSTLTRNSAFYSVGGGAIDNAATMAVTNSTLFDNSSTYGGEGGAILNTGTLSLTASTLSHNAAANDGAGIYGPATITASILAQNTEGGDCSQTVTDGGDNLADDTTCGFTAPTDISNVPAGLAPGGLTDNGGPTKTIALESVSPAIGADANTSVCSTPDQRGVSRPTPCDIGSVQLALPPQVITSADQATATVGKPFSFTVTTTGLPVPTISKMGKLPKHLVLHQATNGTATISGTPLKAGVYHFTLRSTYGTGGTKTVVLQPFTLTVKT
jgi:hypothetical protein